jgi:hypothetical protein
MGAKIKVFTCFTVLLPTTKRTPAKYIFNWDHITGTMEVNNFSFTVRQQRCSPYWFFNITSIPRRSCTRRRDEPGLNTIVNRDGLRF